MLLWRSHSVRSWWFSKIFSSLLMDMGLMKNLCSKLWRRIFLVCQIGWSRDLIWIIMDLLEDQSIISQRQCLNMKRFRSHSGHTLLIFKKHSWLKIYFMQWHLLRELTSNERRKKTNMIIQYDWCMRSNPTLSKLLVIFHFSTWWVKSFQSATIMIEY